jgi:hypothetical protein
MLQHIQLLMLQKQTGLQKVTPIYTMYPPLFLKLSLYSAEVGFLFCWVSNYTVLNIGK